MLYLWSYFKTYRSVSIQNIISISDLRLVKCDRDRPGTDICSARDTATAIQYSEHLCEVISKQADRFPWAYTKHNIYFWHLPAKCDLDLSVMDLGLAHEPLTQYGENLPEVIRKMPRKWDEWTDLRSISVKQCTTPSSKDSIKNNHNDWTPIRGFRYKVSDFPSLLGASYLMDQLCFSFCLTIKTKGRNNYIWCTMMCRCRPVGMHKSKVSGVYWLLWGAVLQHSTQVYYPTHFLLWNKRGPRLMERI